MALDANRDPAVNQPATFLFAPEIEQALVAAAFQKPERIALIYRDLDPVVHITQPHLRHILAAIDLAYRELGSTDFASVVQILREEGRLVECGGLEGVNSVLEQYRYGFSTREAAEEIIDYYIELLRTYAINRRQDPPLPVYRFIRGRATLMFNKIKRRESEPDYLGEARICGRWYTVGASLSEDGSFLNFCFEPKL